MKKINLFAVLLLGIILGLSACGSSEGESEPIEYSALSAAVGATTENSATINCSAAFDNSTDVSLLGCVYSTDSNPALGNNNTTFVAAPSIKNGNFTVELTGLTPNTTYYYCVCIKIGERIIYGKIQSFTTKDSGGSGDETNNYIGSWRVIQMADEEGELITIPDYALKYNVYQLTINENGTATMTCRVFPEEIFDLNGTWSLKDNRLELSGDVDFLDEYLYSSLSADGKKMYIKLIEGNEVYMVFERTTQTIPAWYAVNCTPDLAGMCDFIEYGNTAYYPNGTISGGYEIHPYIIVYDENNEIIGYTKSSDLSSFNDKKAISGFLPIGEYTIRTIASILYSDIYDLLTEGSYGDLWLGAWFGMGSQSVSITNSDVSISTPLKARTGELILSLKFPSNLTKYTLTYPRIFLNSNLEYSQAETETSEWTQNSSDYSGTNLHLTYMPINSVAMTVKGYDSSNKLIFTKDINTSAVVAGQVTRDSFDCRSASSAPSKSSSKAYSNVSINAFKAPNLPSMLQATPTKSNLQSRLSKLFHKIKK